MSDSKQVDAKKSHPHDAVPGVRLCIACQEEADESTKSQVLYNRRGSKDSQLR